MSAPGTTRARAIRETASSALSEATLDLRAGTADKLKDLKLPRRPENGAPERCFRIVFGLLPHRGDFISSDFFLIELTIEIYYALTDRKSTRLNSSHIQKSRMPSSA